MTPLLQKFIDSFYSNTQDLSQSIVMNAMRWDMYSTVDSIDVINISLDKAISYKNIIVERAAYLNYFFVSETYGVYYYSNGGLEITIDTYSYKAKKMVIIKNNNFTFNGKTFVEWNTKSDGSGESHKEGAIITIQSDLVLYAIWK